MDEYIGRIWRVLVSFIRACKGYLGALLRDIRGLFKLIQIETRIFLNEKRNTLLADVFRKNVRKSPNKPCIIYNNEIWTFQNLEDYSNKVAEVFYKRFKLKKGDCVAVFMENKPEYVGIMLGLSKIGVISALINTNLKNQQLIHCINISKPKYIIYSNELEKSLNDVRGELTPGIVCIAELFTTQSQNPDNLYLLELLKQANGEIVTCDEPLRTSDILLYIYTSGTTGLPKPAIIKQNRYVPGSFVFFISGEMSRKDIVYNSLPIYHANGIIIGMGCALVCGATVVLRKKFSASQFWRECVQYRCTAFIYVGEICRFLVNQPESTLDRTHTVRLAIGNGLRTNVWKEFYARFGVRCMEFYAASEGNCTMANTESHIGACGYVPLIKFLRFLLPINLIRVDDEMNPIRNNKGFCIQCKDGEKGLVVGIIGDTPKKSFTGYANSANESKKKIIENLFYPGQRAFNTGDLMVRDKYGYMYFSDRTGDTYRWRGENVSTVEIENVISKKLKSAEVVVYGVEIPGEEGRAGMAALVIKDNARDSLDLAQLGNELKQELPSYSIPLFIRIVDQVEHTSTFKVKKTSLVEQGFDLSKVNGDMVYFFDTQQSKTYRQLDQNVYNEIIIGQRRF